MRRFNLHSLLALILALGLVSCSSSPSEAEEEEQALVCNTAFDASAFPAATVSFTNDIVPILAANSCSSEFCHGGAQPPSNFSVRTAVSILGPGDEAKQLGICNVVRGQPDQSYIIMKLTGAQGILGERMPFGGDPISNEHLQVIRQWILEGARNN